jgi:ATP-binding cassette subfamily G (WHITE) protein 2
MLVTTFWVFWITYYFTLGNGVMLAYLISSAAPNMEAANAILPTYVVGFRV